MAETKNEKLLDDIARVYNIGDIDDGLNDQRNDYTSLTKSTRAKMGERVWVDPNNTLDGNISKTAYTSTYGRAGTFFHDANNWTSYGNSILEASFRSMGSGGYTNVLQNFLSKLDRHGTALVPLNCMNYGFTFITRPRLNLTDGNLIQHPILSGLISRDADSVAFMIRALLDTRLSGGPGCGISYFGGKGIDQDADIVYDKARAKQSKLFDWQNPFFVPLCNGLKGISGFPDFMIEATPIGEDFHSGDWTYARGSDMLNRTQELSLEFRDVQGSIILSCFFYWCLYVALQAKNVVQAYPDDIYAQRLNYTVSIYRFVTDATRRNILWWAKATGCFPKSAPVGALFNVNQGEVTIQAAQNFSIPFTANKIEYNDPGILYDFKSLVARYAAGSTPGVSSYNRDVKIFSDENIWPIVPTNPINGSMLADWNFIGLPDIVNDPKGHGIQLVWRTNTKYAENLPINNPTAETGAAVDRERDLDADKLQRLLEQVRDRSNQGV